MSDVWLTTLETETPQEGFELAIKPSRMSVKYIQPDEEVRKKLRPFAPTMPTASRPPLT
jgi:hypothetical protein